MQLKSSFNASSGYFTSYSGITSNMVTHNFNYLGKVFTITNRTNPYDIMSDMVQHAISQGALVILIE